MIPEQLKLTKKQLDVLNLVLKGYSNTQMSKALGVSNSAIKLRLSGILAKYKVTNRYELMSIYTDWSLYDKTINHEASRDQRQMHFPGLHGSEHI